MLLQRIRYISLFQEGDPNFHSSSSFDVKKLFLIACDLDN